MEDVKVVVKHRGVYCNTVGRFLSEAVVVEMMNKFKDAGFTDLFLIGNTDRIETLGLENHINLAEHVMFSAVTLAERVPGSSETAKSSAGVDVIEEPAPLLPAVHLNIGGIPTSWLTQDGHIAENTIVPETVAAGEADCASDHGADPLGTNSLRVRLSW